MLPRTCRLVCVHGEVISKPRHVCRFIDEQRVYLHYLLIIRRRQGVLATSWSRVSQSRCLSQRKFHQSFTDTGEELLFGGPLIDLAHSLTPAERKAR